MAKKNMAIFLVCAAIVFAILAYYLFLPERPVIDRRSGKVQMQEIVSPQATGDIDDVVNALMKELLDEESLLTEEEIDTAFVTTDGQEIDDFGQSINEDEL